MDDIVAINWRQSGPARWAGKDLDGYSLQAWQTKGVWHWSLRVPGPGGYVVKKGSADSAEVAKLAVEAAYHWLMNQAPRHTPKKVPAT